MIDDFGLVGDQCRLDADRQIGGDPAHRGLDVAAQRQDIAAVAHRDGKPDRRFSVDPEHRLRRVGVAAAHLGDIAQPQDPPSPSREIDVADILLGGERAGDLQRYRFLAGAQHPRRAHDILRLQGCDQCARIDAQAGELREREVDVDHFILSAEHVDLRDVGYFQKFAADVLHVVAQFAEGESVRSKPVDRAVGIAELVVEERADDALRQRLPHVADLFAHVVPGVLDSAPVHAAEKVDEDHRSAGGGVAAQYVKMRHLLQGAFEPLRHLQQRLVERGARPLRLHDHRADREHRVLRPAEAQKRQRPGGDDHDHQKDDDRAIADRPLGKVESAHDAAPSSLTFSPGRNDCTPAVTTTSPGSSPCPTITCARS